MKIKVLHIIFLWLVFCTWTMGSLKHQKINYNYKQLSIVEGLSHSAVTSVLKDFKGNLWIGTRSGLNLLDYNGMHNYLHDTENDSSLPSNHILFVSEDSLHNIWISTTGGLTMYNTEKDCFILKLNNRVYHSLPKSDGIFFSGDNCLYYYDYKLESFETFFINSTEKELTSDRYKIFEINQLNSYQLLLSTKNEGFFLYDQKSKKIESFNLTSERTMTSTHIDKDGNIYCSFYNRGLFCYNKEGRFTAQYTTQNSDLSYDIILDIYERDGELWLATDGGGITIYNKEEENMRSLRHIPGDNASLPVNSITLLYEDQDKDLWAGTVRDGIFQIKETYIRVMRDVALANKNGLSEKAIISLFEDNDSILWIGTDGGGVNNYNPHTNQFTHFLKTYGDKVVSITDLSEKELLVSLYGKGVFIFNKKSGSYRPFTIVNDSVHYLECNNGFMPLLHRVNSDQIVILSQNAYIYHPSNDTFTLITSSDDRLSVDALNLQYADEQYIFLSKDNNIYSLSNETYLLTQILSLDESETIRSVCFDGKRILWIASDRGLSYYNLKKKELKYIETKMFNEISYLFIDDRSRLWISAQNRLFSYFIPQNRFVICEESEGFISNEILFIYQQKSQTNNIYLGGTNGLVIIDKNISFGLKKDEKVNLINILLNGKSYLNELNEDQSTINIPRNYTSMSITMGNKEKDVFSRTLYRYSITGLSTQYTETYNRQINLPQLPVGSYSIMASYITSSGEWSKPSRIISINIQPPWFLKSWFIMIIIILTLLIIYGVIAEVLRRNKYNLILEMKEIEQTVNEKKINFLVNVSHEMRTPLTLIYAPLKRLLQNDLSSIGYEQIKEQLKLIFAQTQQMKNIINMVLDINKLNTGYETIVKRLHPLNIWIKEVTEDFRDEMDYKQINLLYETDENLELVPFDADRCKIVLSNLLMNALKFSDRETTIIVSTKKEEEMACISVSDEGIGLKDIDPDLLFSRFYQGKHGKHGSGIGLSYSKALVEKHGGNIGASDNDTIGATFFFCIPLFDDSIVTEVGEMKNFNSHDEINLSDHSNKSIQLTQDLNLSNHSIMIVEDNTELLNFLQDSLRYKFKNVIVATNGRSALNQIKLKQPDIVVSDVMMPEMDGYELCRQIKTTLEISHIPVVLLTAKTDSDSIEIGYKKGADFYITKPFDISFLELIISNLISARLSIKTKYNQASGYILPEEATISSADENFLMRISKLITDNLSDPKLNVDFLATEMAMSRSSLYNKMNNLLATGVNNYINKIRIDKALNLLKNTDMTIGDIAIETGFKNQRYFSTLFKQIEGVSPSECRKQN